MDDMKILVVEDESDTAQLLKTVLENEGEANVDVACNASAAESALRSEEEWDGIVLDLNLGETQGIDSYNRIRAAAPNTAIIAYTGGLDGQTSQRLAEDGVRILIKGLESASAIWPIIKGSIESFRATRAAKQLLNSA